MARAVVSRAPDDTRTRLIRAAERLFAERGIDSVSLREINRESGARNAVALQYHFEDRAGIVQAIIDKHSPDVESRRQAMLDQYEAEGEADLRFLAAALVRPLAAKLADPDGGPEFLQIHADLMNRPQPIVAGAGEDETVSTNRWRALIEPLLAPEAVALHRRFAAMLFNAVELGRRARSGPHTDDRLFTSSLVDVVTAMLGAPVSDETSRLAAERDAVVGRRRRAAR
jgi:AcrR family transcriptional regulator